MLARRAIVLSVFALIGCQGESGVAPKRPPGNELRLASQSDISTFDPAICFNVTDCALLRLAYEGLIDYGDGTDWVPWIAEEVPPIPEDGKTYTFHLRKGVYFAAEPGMWAEGEREVTAQDFVYSMERILDPKTCSPGDGYFRNIKGSKAFIAAREEGDTDSHMEGLQALDRYTLRIILDEPDPAFLHCMTMGFTYAVAREVVEKYGKEKFGVHPVGTGPYRVVEWARGSRLRMALRPEYKGPPPKAMPAIDVQIGGDTFTAQMMFERGLIDFRTEIPPPDHVRITTSPQWKNCVHRAEEVDFNYLAFNCEMEPFTNKQVRQALSHAINKDRLLQSINNRGVIARGVLPPLMPGYNKELKERYPYDPERAKKMLAEAGYPNGFSMQLWVSFERPDWMKMAQQVQQDFKAVGVQVVIKEVSGNTFIDISGKRGAAQSLIYGWVQDYPDPSDFLDVLFNGERIADENCNNTSFYDNKDVNERLKEAQRVTTDQAKRLRLYQDIEKQIVEDAPMVFLYHAVDYRQCQPWLKGYQTHPVWWVRYDKIWVESP